MRTRSISELWFASFADSRLKGSLWRLRRQARKFGFQPDRTLIIDETGLDSDFRERMKDSLVPGSRGFGYWCWKPQIVLQAFAKMEDGDILVYADAGCHLNKKGRERLLSYLPMVEKQGLGIFQLSLIERQWTKGDLFDAFGVRDRHDITDIGQIVGGVFLAMKTDAVYEFFRRHLAFLQDNVHLVDDTPSLSPNLSGFTANRHDQSAFSLRCKLRGLETFDATDLSGNNAGVDCPIVARRDLGVGWRGYVPFWFKRLCFVLRDWAVAAFRP